MSNCVNVTEVTTIAGCVAALGVIALIASGWRQPARVERSSPRGLQTRLRGFLRLPANPGTGSVNDDPAATSAAPLDPAAVLPTTWWQRARAVAGGTGLAIWMGAIAATVIGFAAAFVVISLTSMLRR
jgi:hypothetical protein